MTVIFLCLITLDQAQHPVGFAARVLTVVISYFEVATDRDAQVLVLCHFV